MIDKMKVEHMVYLYFSNNIALHIPLKDQIVDFNNYLLDCYNGEVTFKFDLLIRYYEVLGDKIIKDSIEFAMNEKRDDIVFYIFSFVDYEDIRVKCSMSTYSYIDKMKNKFDLLNEID